MAIEIKYEPIDKSDIDLDIMTIEAWIEYVNDGSFIDDDGHGCLATEYEKTNLRVYPSYVFDNKIIYVRQGFSEKISICEKDIEHLTHVIWYNK